MAGRPNKEDSKSKGFSIYDKTWLVLKDLEHFYIKRDGNCRPLKEIVHDAIEVYSKKEKNNKG